MTPFQPYQQARVRDLRPGSLFGVLATPAQAGHLINQTPHPRFEKSRTRKPWHRDSDSGSAEAPRPVSGPVDAVMTTHRRGPPAHGSNSRGCRIRDHQPVHRRSSPMVCGPPPAERSAVRVTTTLSASVPSALLKVA